MLIKNQQGIALVVTLLAVALITAMVVEFSYGVYIATSNIYNWRDAQRLSLMAKSGINVSAKYLSEWVDTQSFTPGAIELPVENPFEDFQGVIAVRIQDENSKFNINTIVYPRGDMKNPIAYDAFKRLLKTLSLKENIADRIVDWIDRDSAAELSDSEINAKNADLISIDELLLINGITRDDYDKLMPYVTVYGNRDNLIINVNGAEKPVLMCISDSITEELAGKIIKYRIGMPFRDINEFNNFAGTTFGANQISVKGDHFKIYAQAFSNGVRTIIEAVVYKSPLSSTILKFWKEY
ncbi:MAG: type II secretion system minor pseudopilin GspK [Nitrospirae bacterium]|nr:type II secretion system minor pseudopilin GspK [Nitrospirota bacterium]